MTALLLNSDKQSGVTLQRVSLSGDYDERWLQVLLFAHPGLLPAR